MGNLQIEGGCSQCFQHAKVIARKHSIWHSTRLIARVPNNNGCHTKVGILRYVVDGGVGLGLEGGDDSDDGGGGGDDDNDVLLVRDDDETGVTSDVSIGVGVGGCAAGEDGFKNDAKASENFLGCME